MIVAVNETRPTFEPDVRSKPAFPSNLNPDQRNGVATAVIDGITTRYEVVGSGPPLLMYSPAGFDATLEKEMFPGAPGEQQARTREVQEQVARALGLQALMESMSGRGKGSRSISWLASFTER